MKIRMSYVSNSSSASFLVFQDLTSQGIYCLKLTTAQKELINGTIINDERIGLDTSKDVYLTEFVFDGDDEKWDKIMNVEHQYYSGGQIGGEPYADDMFNEYRIDGYTSVYLRKEHDEAKQMKFNKFVKDIKETYGTKVEVIVKYEKNGDITLKVVE